MRVADRRELKRTCDHGVAGACHWLIVIACGAIAACGETLQQDDIDAAAGLVVERNVAVPMRDGVILRADVYRPNADGRFPVLVYRTPYGKHLDALSYRTYLRAVERGYAVVLQDVRGRYASDGQFDAYRQEGADGYDTIEWAARQAWSNGSVGTFGLSYPGAAQWLAAIESPPSLQAMAPAMTYASPDNFFYTNGIFNRAWLPWIFLYIAPAARARLGISGITDEDVATRVWPSVAADYLNYLPLSELPYLRDEAPFYFEWLAHPPGDTWWDWADIRDHYDDVDAAVLHLSGWYDDLYGPDGAITNHAGITASRDAPAKSHLIMGPWKHGVAATGEHRLGELDFGAAAAIDYNDVVLRFFDRYLAGRDNGLAEEPPVRYFMTGSNEWLDAPRWPPHARPARLCLSRRTLNDCDGWTGDAQSSFTADPADPLTDPHTGSGPHDYRGLLTEPDVLTFDSKPLAADLRIAGNAALRVFVSCDCRDFDFWLHLLDVHPDGRAINLRSPAAAALRMSYRDLSAGRRLLEAGEIYELQIQEVMLANTFKAGHRVRIQVSAAFAPHLSPNLQTGESEIHARDSLRARITIHHSADYPSALTLPVSRQ